MPDTTIQREQVRLREELALLREFPETEFAEIIREVGFSCTACGSCCRTRQNGHVFLLQTDTDRALVQFPQAIIPAPFFELCDREGRFYVSGYALRADPDGSCIFLSDNRCRIYAERFSICRVYPYMLHREPDAKGRLTFRQISGLNEHGEYHHEISPEECTDIARATIRYEEAWLIQMLEFYDLAALRFEQEGERHVRKVYDTTIRRFRNGDPVEVFTYHRGAFHQITVSIGEYAGILTSTR